MQFAWDQPDGSTFLGCCTSDWKFWKQEHKTVKLGVFKMPDTGNWAWSMGCKRCSVMGYKEIYTRNELAEAEQFLDRQIKEQGKEDENFKLWQRRWTK